MTMAMSINMVSVARYVFLPSVPFHLFKSVPTESASFILAYAQHIFDAVKASLKRLQLDYIDLYQCMCVHVFQDLLLLLITSIRESRPSL